MKAIVCNGTGGPEVLSYEDVETPKPAPGEVLVKVAAVGVNRADMLQAAGHYPPPKGTSELLGLEVSGHVAEVADDVFDLRVGDPVVCLLAGGGYAEYVVVPAGQCVPPPPGMDLVTAAGVLECAATVVSNIGDLVDEDDWFLVHGGTGGIGAFAIQYAKAKGAKVAATAGSKEKLEICRQLGADVAIDYHDDWVAILKEETGKHNADVILDVMGAKYLERHLKAVAVDGDIIVIGLQGGRKAELDIALLLNKRASITATSLRFRPQEQKAAICQRVVDEVWPLYEDGSIQPPRETRYPLAEAAKAHEQLASGANVGKIVLTV